MNHGLVTPEAAVVTTYTQYTNHKVTNKFDSGPSQFELSRVC